MKKLKLIPVLIFVAGALLAQNNAKHSLGMNLGLAH